MKEKRSERMLASQCSGEAVRDETELTSLLSTERRVFLNKKIAEARDGIKSSPMQIAKEWAVIKKQVKEVWAAVPAA